ncbi:MAG TPA: cupin domain-containing protein [Alphaproteobacteria bacterium]|nr:cupin domain-containing protein [Alphaproteobacteria bacterium]
MVNAINIEAALADVPVLAGRTPGTPEAEVAAAFATLAGFGNGALFAGSFSGESQWERHPKGDELVHILKGLTTLTILMDAGPQVLELGTGMLTVVPQGRWHRFHAPDGVTVLTATPQPTDHSSADDPRGDG